MTTITRRIVRPTSSNTDGTHGDSASNSQFQSSRNDADDRDKDDERDNDDDKEARLTLMEEVLLLGLKDREVRAKQNFQRHNRDFFLFHRVTRHSGMIVSPLVYAAVS